MDFYNLGEFTDCTEDKFIFELLEEFSGYPPGWRKEVLDHMVYVFDANNIIRVGIPGGYDLTHIRFYAWKCYIQDKHITLPGEDVINKIKAVIEEYETEWAALLVSFIEDTKKLL